MTFPPEVDAIDYVRSDKQSAWRYNGIVALTRAEYYAAEGICACGHAAISHEHGSEKCRFGWGSCRCDQFKQEAVT